MITNSAFTVSYSKKPSLYQRIDRRQIILLTGGQQILDSDSVDKIRSYVTTMKAMTFQDDVPSFLNDDFKVHYVQVIDSTSTQSATEKYHYTELVEEPLTLELNFIYLS